ncbi:hypothetical protein ACFSCX_16145 [Bacillus salitolerans]|uniref:C2H2-type domain-containing protein n=1 Tax=Bacillus salitolerans TaxID=1437434 RepID=A0ABW4LSL6_9BACI
MPPKKKRTNKQNNSLEDFGTTTFICKSCQHEFEVEWEIIWEIQEYTHGYVGYDTTDVYMDCPKCGKTVEGSE